MTMLFTIFATNVFAADIGRFNSSISAGNDWMASVARSKTNSNANAVFNVKDYNDYTSGYVKDSSGNLTTVEWTIYCDPWNGAVQAMNIYSACSGQRMEKPLYSNYRSTSYDYYLYMGNPHMYRIYVCGSYTPG